ncbi:Hypothetical predicted protein [Podarcis lilfordi]|uniref:Uncharacterized protein n=1 Tax=Podarcis lilfordi TaxID=74358 RepID=A0AA35LMB9_9SAUR|nr:Hypothetical predicted protein [Podarcis lilfordi]
MGCVESNEVLSSEAIDTNSVAAPPAPQTTAPASEKVKKKRRHSLRERWATGKKTSTEDLGNRTESTKIHVIWRRVSLFSTKRDSLKSMSAEVAGPSHLNSDQEPQPDTSEKFGETY